MTPAECRQRAALCQSKADTANDTRARQRYLELVEQWSSLAAKGAVIQVEPDAV